MLKKLKIGFILTNMLLVGLVVAFIFTAICVMTYRTQMQEIDRSLEQVIFSRGRNEPHIGGMGSFFPDHFEKEEEYELPYIYAFPVLVDYEGNVLVSYDSDSDMDEDVLIEAIRAVLKAEEEGGTLKSLGLIYLRREMTLGYMIAFASMEHLYTTMKNTVFVALAACLISLLLFLMISILLSNIAIRPIEEAWRRQKQFVADASHDLKTPLTVILANNNILLSHGEESVESQRQWVESTDEEAQRMRGLVDRLLMLAKSEDTVDSLLFEDYCISDLCEQVILQFEAVAFERNIMIESDIMPNLYTKTNEEAFVRLTHILLDNAVKYSPDGETVNISLSVKRSGICLSVQNRGDMISAEDLPHLFERFYRADKARGVGGYGLGLSIAKNLAESLRGEISVSSDERNGTIFTVQFKK